MRQDAALIEEDGNVDVLPLRKYCPSIWVLTACLSISLSSGSVGAMVSKICMDKGLLGSEHQP